MTIEQIFKLVSPIISILIGAVIKYYTEERSKLISFLGHVSSFTLQGEQQTKVFAHSVIVRNAGRKAARNVRLSHNILPPNIDIYPPIQYSIEQNPSSSAEIVIPVLVPKEQITISYLYFPPLTWDQINNNAKSDDGLAKIVKVILIPQPSKWTTTITWFLWFLMFIGSSFLLYWTMRLIASII